jgi:hypothetical protein
VEGGCMFALEDDEPDRAIRELEHLFADSW